MEGRSEGSEKERQDAITSIGAGPPPSLVGCYDIVP